MKPNDKTVDVFVDGKRVGSGKLLEAGIDRAIGEDVTTIAKLEDGKMTFDSITMSAAFQPTEKESFARALLLFSSVAAEAFDRALPGHDFKGDWMPDPPYMKKSNANALACYRAANFAARSLGCATELANARLAHRRQSHEADVEEINALSFNLKNFETVRAAWERGYEENTDP